MSGEQDVVFYVLSSDGDAEREASSPSWSIKFTVKTACATFVSTKSKLEHASTRSSGNTSHKRSSACPRRRSQRTCRADSPMAGEHRPTLSGRLAQHPPRFPEAFEQYRRTIEVLDQSERLIQMGRERWKTYKAKGFEPVVHKI